MTAPFAKKTSTPSKAFLKKPTSTKRNKSITNFFQKTDSPPGATSRQSRITQFVTASQSPSSGRTSASQNGTGARNETTEGLFLEDKRGRGGIETASITVETSERARSKTPDDIWEDDFLETGDSRYNENEASAKRRKVDSSDALTETTQSASTKELKESDPPKKTNNGPFIDESDDEDDMEAYRELEQTSPLVQAMNNDIPSTTNYESSEDLAELEQLPPLVRDAATYIGHDGQTNFDELEEDGYVGQELRENFCWEDIDLEQPSERVDLKGLNDPRDDEPNCVTCPICQTPLAGQSETVCLDLSDSHMDGGHSSTISAPEPPTEPPSPLPAPSESPVNLFDGLKRSEKAGIARPAQNDPYLQNQNVSSSRSAFSKMMAGNAEDSAWATAASNEVSSRGKQAYQRTCPFYKILNGFAITVDAFRYGAVQGCNAYFLSHFHSDHYIGLSKAWCHGPIYCSRPTANLVREKLRVDPKWVVDLEFETTTEVPNTGGVQVTMIQANHCPGSSLFLFEKTFGSGSNTRNERILHCGDFRASVDHIKHPLLCPDPINPVTGKPRQQRLDKCYLDTTYLDPKYAFPSQENVINACSKLCVRLNEESGVGADAGQAPAPGLMSKFLSTVTNSDRKPEPAPATGGRLLVVIGTYSIGKERICLGIAKALGSKIFATPAKQKICACLEDAELSSYLTSDPREAQVHMQTLFEIRADTLSEYLDGLKPAFSRVVGFRPTGWSYRAPAGRMLVNPPVPTVLRGEHWQSSFTVDDLQPQRGSTRESACYGVPYSEHSSFRELTMFCCALRIGRVIPTVNVGSEKSREKMKAWMDRWEGEKRKNGLFPASEWS